jgi:uncharacterized repeat protein (TIGR02543 family)
MKSKLVVLLIAGFLLLFACTNPVIERLYKIDTLGTTTSEVDPPEPPPAVTYMVAFDSNGGSPVDSLTVAEGDKATRPQNPTKSGFGFVNWYDCDALTKPHYDFATLVTSDITLFAEWSRNFHTVTFNSDGGSDVADQAVGENGTVSRPSDPTKSGYDFVNWYSDSGLSTVYDFATSVSGGFTLYAGWIDADFPGEVIHRVFDVSNTAEWNTAISAISNGGNDKNYIINVIADFIVPGVANANFSSASGIKVSFRGVGRTLTLTAPSSRKMLFTNSGQTLILRDLILQGHYSNLDFLVYVKGGAKEGTFIMQSGKICGNGASSWNCGGVGLAEGGIFTMNGGEISGNHANSGAGVSVSNGTFTMNGGIISGNSVTADGGGVYVEGKGKGTFTMNGGKISGNNAKCWAGGVLVANGGTFTMYDGKISDNNANDWGGGVLLVNDGAFTMYGGEISGNKTETFGGGVYNRQGTFRIVTGTIYGKDEDDPSLRNYAVTVPYNSGTALSLHESAVQTQYGKFDGATWVKTDDLNTTDNTIKVKDGVLLQGD